MQNSVRSSTMAALSLLPCYVIKPPGRQMSTTLAASTLLGVATLCAIADKASAGSFSVPGTGQSKTTAGGFTTDNNWKLVAMPDYCTSSNCSTPPAFSPSASTPAPVYIAPAIPTAWVNNNDLTIPPTATTTNAITLRGQTYNWITYANYPNSFGPTVTSGTENGPNSTTSYFNSPLRSPSSPLSIQTAQAIAGGSGQFSGNYSYIMATQFTAQAGTYDINFDASADNQFQLYLVPGALSGVQISKSGSFTPQQPGVLNATLIAHNAANTGLQFNRNWNETNTTVTTPSVTLSAGQYTLLYRITDNWSYSTNYSYGNTGAYAGATYFNQAVPGPLPLFGAATAFAASRRMRRRIKLSRAMQGGSCQPGH